MSNDELRRNAPARETGWPRAATLGIFHGARAGAVVHGPAGVLAGRWLERGPPLRPRPGRRWRPRRDRRGIAPGCVPRRREYDTETVSPPIPAKDAFNHGEEDLRENVGRFIKRLGGSSISGLLCDSSVNCLGVGVAGLFGQQVSYPVEMVVDALGHQLVFVLAHRSVLSVTPCHFSTRKRPQLVIPL